MSFVIKIYMTLLYLNEYNVNMNKREYAQTNKDWLTAKAQEEGVKPLPKGIYYRVLAEGKDDGLHRTEMRARNMYRNCF